MAEDTPESEPRASGDGNGYGDRNPDERSRGRGNDGRGTRGGSRGGDHRLASATDAIDWLALSVVRLGLAVLGVVLVLYAVGMLTGVDALDVAYDALGSEMGRWIAVAVVGVFLLLVAIGGFGSSD